MRENHDISIVQVVPPQNTGLGDYYYRVESPAEALSKLAQVRTVVTITNLHRERDALANDADVLIINHVCDPDLLPIIARRKASKLPTVFEVGDNIHDIQSWNVTHAFWHDEENRSLYHKLISACDALQANNPVLISQFGHLNHKHLVFPNQMRCLETDNSSRQEDGLVIGWGGSHGHIEDVGWIAPDLIGWLDNHPQVRFSFMGSEEMFRVFEDIPGEQRTYHKPGAIADYYDFLRTLDIGVAPLKETPYNRCRSDVKFIEYAAFGVVPVLQDLDPYQSTAPEGRLLFREPKELVEVLDRLVSDPELRKRISQKASGHVRDSRLEDQHAVGRLESYTRLLPNDHGPSAKTGALSDLRGHVPAEETEYEGCLYDGLVLMQQEAAHASAAERFKEAERQAPQSYLPNLFLSQCSPDQVAELERCLHKNPSSLKACLLLAEAHKKHGDLAPALGSFKKAIQIYPDYDLPYRKAIEILSTMGMSEPAARLQEAVDRIRQSSCLDPGRPAQKATPGVTAQTADSRIIMVLPRGNDFGWGLCGRHLVREIAKLSQVTYATQELTPESVGDELDYELLKQHWVPLTGLEEEMRRAEANGSPAAVIQAIQGSNLQPWGVTIDAPRKIGYTFFEESILAKENIRAAQAYFDVVAAGSTWCEDILRHHGLNNTQTIIQGIEPADFNPSANGKTYFKDQFVIFSGGKFEFRKGQDLVIRAFGYLQEKYDDVLLVNSWQNHWQQSIQTMSASKHIQFELKGRNHQEFVSNLLAINGIDPKRVIILPPKPNALMSRIYKNSDIGLFPNRCEGGTNLVLMEYMACGKPPLASLSSGHRDILTPDNAIPLQKLEKIDIHFGGEPLAVWDDPDLDEVIDRLEWAYLNQGKLKDIGQKAGEDLSRLTWEKAASRFYELTF